MPTKGWPRGSVLGGWGGAARGGSAGVALAVGWGLAAYGFSCKNDPLAQLLALNPEFARREQAGEPVTAPAFLPPIPTLTPIGKSEPGSLVSGERHQTAAPSLVSSHPDEPCILLCLVPPKSHAGMGLFLVSIEPGTPMPDLSLPSLVCPT